MIQKSFALVQALRILHCTSANNFGPEALHVHQFSFFRITGQNYMNENSDSADGSIEIMQDSQNLPCTGPKRGSESRGPVHTFPHIKIEQI